MKILVVVDMQKDFVNGSLGTNEAEVIVPNVCKRIDKAKKSKERVIFTRDTHQENYLNTQEGANLPVIHCVKGTEGWNIIPELQAYTVNECIIDKPTFGSYKLGKMLQKWNEAESIEEITMIGLCTDICVISNAMLVKAFLPEVRIVVEEDCCAGVTPESHLRALAAMKQCQIIVR